MGTQRRSLGASDRKWSSSLPLSFLSLESQLACSHVSTIPSIRGVFHNFKHKCHYFKKMPKPNTCARWSFTQGSRLTSSVLRTSNRVKLRIFQFPALHSARSKMHIFQISFPMPRAAWQVRWGNLYLLKQLRTARKRPHFAWVARIRNEEIFWIENEPYFLNCRANFVNQKIYNFANFEQRSTDSGSLDRSTSLLGRSSSLHSFDIDNRSSDSDLLDRSTSLLDKFSTLISFAGCGIPSTVKVFWYFLVVVFLPRLLTLMAPCTRWQARTSLSDVYSVKSSMIIKEQQLSCAARSAKRIVR